MKTIFKQILGRKMMLATRPTGINLRWQSGIGWINRYAGQCPRLENKSFFPLPYNEKWRMKVKYLRALVTIEFWEKLGALRSAFFFVDVFLDVDRFETGSILTAWDFGLVGGELDFVVTFPSKWR
jgi:hypothetical protein